MVLVDSSIWIEAARKDGDLTAKVGLENLLEAYEATLCPPVLLEVLGGARSQDRRRLENAFAILPFQRLHDQTWSNAVKQSWRVRDAGLSIPWNDLLVATFSIELGCRVYARDRHFEQMQTVLGVRLYEPGYGGQFAPDNAA